MSESLLARIRSADNLPSLPAVALQVLRLTRDDNTSVQDLAEVIHADPALTARILKVVNSSLFGFPREIGSLAQAMALLGFRRVKIMALSFSVVEMVRGEEVEGLGLQAYWRRSLSTAAAARLLAKAVISEATEEAFAAGLLSDVGMVVAWRCAREIYEPVVRLAETTGRPLLSVEAERLGCTHARIGRALLKAWGLPDPLCDAVGSHHGEGLAGLPASSALLAKVVHSAATIAGLFCQTIPPGELERVKSQCLGETGVDQERFQELLESLDHQVRDTAAMLAVGIGETLDYTQLQTEAITRMANLSMEAEAERAESQRKEQHALMETQRLQQEKAVILEVASTDSLTKVANRAAFDQRLGEELRRASETGRPLGLVIMDIDHFKKCNDTYGHRAGDCVLRQVGACLREVVRDVGFSARYGGEEFAVIVADEAAEAVRAMAEEIRKALEARVIKHDGRELRVTASFGVACVDSPSSTVMAEHLVQKADRQLYLAKQHGRNRVEAES